MDNVKVAFKIDIQSLHLIIATYLNETSKILIKNALWVRSDAYLWIVILGVVIILQTACLEIGYVMVGTTVLTVVMK